MIDPKPLVHPLIIPTRYMQRLFLSLAAAFLGCLAIPANLNAQDAVDYYNHGLGLYDRREYDMAIANFDQALRLYDPHDTEFIAQAYGNRGEAWNRKGEYEKALGDYNQSLAANPNDADAYLSPAWLYATCPDETYRDGKKAFEYASKAYQLGGGRHWYCLGVLAAAYAECGDFEKAKQWQAMTIAMMTTDRRVTRKEKADASSRLELYSQGKPFREEPRNAQDYLSRGIAWKEMGEYDKALADYSHALAANPTFANAYSSLAWLQTTCPDAKYRDEKKGFQNASKAYQLSGGKDWDTIDTLAAAYAENDDFDAAKEWEAKAIELAPDEKSKVELRSRLELYKQGRPYREELKK